MFLCPVSMSYVGLESWESYARNRGLSALEQLLWISYYYSETTKRNLEVLEKKKRCYQQNQSVEFPDDKEQMD
jgi:hypothetical protein